MRWLIASSQHHPTHGGIGTYISRFIAAAVDAGWRIDLITRPSDLHPPGAAIHEIQTPDMLPEFADRLPALRRIERIRPYRYALWSRAVAQKLMTLRPHFDAIEFVDCQAEGVASLSGHRVRDHFDSARMVVHAHTPMFVEESINHVDTSRFGRQIYHRWEREAIAAADGVIATSRLLADRLTARREPCIIPYPIRSGAGALPAEPCDETILLIGSVQPRKGVDVWARSLNRVLRERPRAKAILIGPDTPTAPDGLSMAAHVQRLIDPRVIDRFRWLGSLPHEEVLSQIRKASLVVVPSVFESFSFVAAEALDHGTPVIVSESVGLAEHIHGLPAVPAGNHEALAERQLSLLADRSESVRRAMACRASMLDRCSPERHLNQRIAFVDSLRPEGAAAINGDDGMDRLGAFIDEVESDERSAASASIAVS